MLFDGYQTIDSRPKAAVAASLFVIFARTGENHPLNASIEVAQQKNDQNHVHNYVIYV